MNSVVILAGGRGSRLSERLGSLPKPMMDIGGKPLLARLLEECRENGFRRVLLLAGYRAEAIRSYFGTGASFGVELEYQVEAEPLGTAGAVLAARDRLAETFLVLYGDELLHVDLQRFRAAHERARADASLFLHPNDHPQDSDLVEVDAEGWIRAFHRRPHAPDRHHANLVNAALYVVNRAALDPWPAPRAPLDFGADLFPEMLRRGARLLGYRSPEYIKDIGTPARHDRVCAEWAAGVVQRSSLRSLQTAVFLDRDGTLNTEIGGVCRPDQLELLPRVAPAIRELNHHGIRAVVVTNQPVVAKGFCSVSELEQVHHRLEHLLGREHAFLDRIYYCPHHPDRGFPGERLEFKVECSCRKPKPGMILQAVADLNIDLSRSWMMGDSTADLATARNAGLRSILLRTGHAGADGKYAAAPDFVFDNLEQAVHFIVTRQSESR